MRERASEGSRAESRTGGPLACGATRRRGRRPRGIACLALGLGVSACSLLTLKKDIERDRMQAAVEGHAGIAAASSAPIVVVVYDPRAAAVADLFVLPRPGPFFFTLAPGTYQLGAFEDHNRDLSHQPADEPAVLLGAPTDVALQPGEHRTGLDLTIDPGAKVRLPFAVGAVAADGKRIHRLPSPQLGTIVDLDDPRFSDENAKLGLWDPMRFLSSVGAGVYFLEPYDPEKIPVLFVHGALGHPGNWKDLVPTLDRSRFQPWLVYYPTAPDLERVAEMLVRALSNLQFKYRFPRLILVAHSMGGLVTRAALNFAMQHPGTGRIVDIPAFVTLSTPWNGHSGAALGVEYSPVVAPSWRDMAPDSAFLQRLPETALPPECEYSLLFSYHGTSRFGSEANDGTVAVSSELSMPIQLQAARVLGFDETHTGILKSAGAAAQVNAILHRASQP